MIQQFPEGWGGTRAISPANLRREFCRALPHEWKAVYRYHGITPLIRCLIGTKKLMDLDLVAHRDGRLLDCLTFTVIPEISMLWTTFLMFALDGQNKTVILGDSSGNYPITSSDIFQVLPIFNFNHGTKLDLVMLHACRSEFVLICDDDIFWLDRAPLKWAFEQFARDEKLAVISFHPRPHKIPQLREALDQPMGSYCILVRRQIWLEQGLSFKFYKSPDWKTIGNYFDTADYANLLLVQRGFHVLMAPPELRNQLVPFYGTSMWGLKILACRGDVTKVVNPSRPDEFKKAYRTALALLGFHDLLARSGSMQKVLIPPDYLRRTIEVAQSNLDAKTCSEVEQDIQAKLTRMKSYLQIQG